MEFIYDVSFELAGTDGLIFEDEIEIFDFRLKSVTDAISKNKIIGYTTIKLDKDDYWLAKKEALRKIQQELLPYLILKSQTGYRIESIHVKPRPIVKKKGKEIIIRNYVILEGEVHAFQIIPKENFTDFLKKLQSYKDKIEKLNADDRRDLLRAIKFWNRGATDTDAIDKFINFFIAFEIIGKNLVSSWKKDDKGFDLEKEWANVLREVCEKKYGLRFYYGDETASTIRAAILHYRTKKISKEEAEELANKYADRFGADVLNLIVRFIEEKSKS